MAEERFDAIVVGAGAAGMAAAYTLAKAGLQVVVIERGTYPGSKNVMGAVLYRKMMDDVIPDFWKEAPIERHLIEENLWMLTEQSAIKIGHRSADFDQEPYNAFTILRAQFDQWFAKKVEDAGAFLITETTVEDLIRQDGKVVGVRTGREDGDLYADVVIIAEGVWSILAQKLGLAPRPAAHNVAMAVKEIIALPKEKIEDRFGLEDGQGATIELLGEATMGMVGMGFIYTNKESLSVGVGALVSDFQKHKVTPNEVQEHMKNHPSIRPLLEGGEVVEYLGHLIPEGGYRAIPKLYTDGAMLVGDVAMLVNAITREGANMAMTSGKLAAETVIELKQAGRDCSAENLSLYRRKLDESFVMRDLKRFRNAVGLLEQRPHFITLYPKLVDRAAHTLFTVDGVPKDVKQRELIREIKRQRPLLGLLADGYSMLNALGGGLRGLLG